MSSDGSDDSYTLGHSDLGVRYHFAARLARCAPSSMPAWVRASRSFP